MESNSLPDDTNSLHFLRGSLSDISLSLSQSHLDKAFATFRKELLADMKTMLREILGVCEERKGTIESHKMVDDEYAPVHLVDFTNIPSVVPTDHVVETEYNQRSPVSKMKANHSHLEGERRKRKGAFARLRESSAASWDDEPTKCVEDYYHTTGFAQKVARHDYFGHMSLLAISINAVYIGYASQYHDADFLLDAALGVLLCENIFCTIFAAELFIRFLAFFNKRDCLRDKWFKFDFIIVTISMIEVWFIPILNVYTGVEWRSGPIRLLRLARFTRLVRLIRLMRFQGLMAMLIGLRNAFQAMLSSLLIILFLVYVFSVLIFMLLKEDREDTQVSYYWGNIYWCMWYLMMFGTLMESPAGASRRLLELGTFSTLSCVFLIVLFMFLTANTVMNVLIGVMCEVVSSATSSEKDAEAVEALKKGVLVQLLRFDADHNHMISKDELESVLFDKTAQRVLEEFGIELHFLLDNIEMVFSEAFEVPLDHVMEMMLSARGDLPLTFKHLSTVQAFTKWAMDEQESRLRSCILRVFHTANNRQDGQCTDVVYTDLAL